MTTPLPANQDSSLNESANRSIIEEVQLWMDHPSLECISLNLAGSASVELKEDLQRCLELLRTGPMVIEKTGELEVLRFVNPQAVGAGTFGIVFRAFDLTLKRNVAIKILRPAAAMSKNIRARFALEGEALAKCHFEGVIPVYEVGNLNGTPYIAMRWVDGPNLDKIIKSQLEPFSPVVAASLMCRIANAIHLAHQNGILHRDIKPSNVLLARDDNSSFDEFPFQPFVSDFGLAKEFQRSISDDGTNLSIDSPIVGTVHYMSPEQAAGKSHEVSITSDVYSLGVMLYELLTLQCPLEGKTKLEALQKIVNESPRSPRTLNSRVPRELDAIVMKCLEKEPRKRYHTASDFADDLNRFLNGEPVLAKPVGPLGTILKWAYRNPWITASLVTIWLGALVSSSIIFGFYRHNLQLLESEKKALAMADRNLELALKSVKDSYQFVAENTLMDVPHSNATKLELHLKALDFFEKFADQSEYDERSAHLLSIAHHYVANAYGNVSDFVNHKVHRAKCLTLIEGLIAKRPNKAEYHFDLFMNRFNSIYYRFGEPQDVALSSLAPLEKAIELDPTNIDYREALSSCYMQCSFWTDSIESHRLLGKAIEISKALIDEYPDRLFLRKGLVKAYEVLGSKYVWASLPDQAIVPLRDALDCIDRSTLGQPRSFAWLEMEVNCRFWYVRSLCELDDPIAEKEYKLFESKARELEILDTKFKDLVVLRGEAANLWIQYLIRLQRRDEALITLQDILEEFTDFTPNDSSREQYDKVMTSLFESSRSANDGV